MNIALLSPNKNVYSETFIQAHKERLKGKIFFYYSGEVPTELEGGIVINSRRKRIIDIVKGHFRLNRFSLAEQAVMTSFKRNKIDLVFAEYGVTGEKALPICRELGLPLIVHFHGYDASRYEVLNDNNNFSEVFNYARFVVVVSRKMEKDFLKLGCSANKLVYNVCGPREEFLEVNPQFNKQQFVSIGRFVDKKAPYYLVLSFKEIVKKFPKAKLIIAGDGELWNSCKNLAKYWNLEGNILFPGVISKEKYITYLSESIAMVQHSITAEDGNTEGTPISVLEASAAGLPVISTNHAGIPDVIQHKITGLLVEEHDVEGMTEHMLRLLNEPDLGKKLGKNGKRNIQQNFNLEKHIKVLNELVEKQQ